MTPGEYLVRERRRLLVRQGLLGPVWRNGTGEIRIPPASVLAEMTDAPVDPAAERWMRARLAELAARLRAEDDGA